MVRFFQIPSDLVRFGLIWSDSVRLKGLKSPNRKKIEKTNQYWDSKVKKIEKTNRNWDSKVQLKRENKVQIEKEKKSPNREGE